MNRNYSLELEENVARYERAFRRIRQLSEHFMTPRQYEIKVKEICDNELREDL